MGNVYQERRNEAHNNHFKCKLLPYCLPFSDKRTPSFGNVGRMCSLKYFQIAWKVQSIILLFLYSRTLEVIVSNVLYSEASSSVSARRFLRIVSDPYKKGKTSLKMYLYTQDFPIVHTKRNNYEVVWIKD